MDLIIIKDEFIASTKDGSKLLYSRKIQVFTEFLTDKCSVNDSNFKETLRGIDIDKILKSIEYYVKNYDIKFKCTVDNFITVIKSFFQFIDKEYKIHNDNFDSNTKLDMLDEFINKKIDELKLNKTEKKEPLSETDFNLLLNRCDECIKNFNINGYNTNSKYNGNTSMFISAIIMKLVMYTGIKNSVIPTIKGNDYNFELNQIKINGLWINLPNGLSLNMQKYAKLREKILPNETNEEKKDNQFFINSSGQYMKKATSDEVYRIMSQELGITEGEALCKYTIMKHIEAGINIMDIMELTTFSIKTCEHCKECLNEKLNKTKNKYINTKLRGSMLYEIL